MFQYEVAMFEAQNNFSSNTGSTPWHKHPPSALSRCEFEARSGGRVGLRLHLCIWACECWCGRGQAVLQKAAAIHKSLQGTGVKCGTQVVKSQIQSISRIQKDFKKISKAQKSFHIVNSCPAKMVSGSVPT